MFVCCGSRCSCMHKNYYVDSLVEPIDEIKHLLLKRCQNLKLQVMVDLINTMPLKDYAIPTEEEPHCSIVHPPIVTNNFELKPSLISMVQQN